MTRQPCTKTWCEDDLANGRRWKDRCHCSHDGHLHYSWGRCRSGQRWFWHVNRWGNFGRDDHGAEDWHGWVDTDDAAVQAAHDKIRDDAAGRSVVVITRHGLASSKLAEVSREKRKARIAANPSKAKGVSNHGTLWAYHAYHGDMDAPDRGWEEHRIIKLTKKYVWLACEGLEYEGQYFRLDREALERDGHVWGGARWRDRNSYYTEAGMKAWELEKLQNHANWLKNRFHPLPEMPENYTKADILKAFREGSLIHHPDHGGDPAMFRKLVEAKEFALQVRAELDAQKRRNEQNRAEAMAAKEAREARP